MDVQVLFCHMECYLGVAEVRIREQIIKNDLLEVVIGLPSKLFYGTGIPAAILIFNNNKSENIKSKVLFIDAERDFLEGKNQNSLRKQDIENIIKTYDQYQDVEKYARVVNAKEIEEHQIDLSERIKRYYDLMNDIKSKADEAKKLGLNLREYGLFVISQEFLPKVEQPVVISLSKDLSKRLESILDEGWQNFSKREEFLKSVKQIIQELILKEYKDKIQAEDFPKFLNRLVDIVLKKF